MRPLTIIILTLSAILTGCASQLTDSQRYEIASDAYVASVEAAVDLHGAGVLDLDDLRAFDAARRPARLMLRVSSGMSSPPARSSFHPRSRRRGRGCLMTTVRFCSPVVGLPLRDVGACPMMDA